MQSFFYFLAVMIFLMSPTLVKAAEVLCPDPQVEAMVVPSDLARVQEDIDRLSLCVERSKLLQELNELASEKFSNNSALLGNPTPIDMKMLQPISAAEIEENIAPVLNQKPLQNTSQWFVRRVWGKDGQLQAQLITSEGMLATVKKGEQLSDGSKVQEISIRGVEVKNKKGKVIVLDWQEER